MIGSLRGTLQSKTPEGVLIEAGGVGYEVTVPLSSLVSLPAAGEEAFLHTWTYVREDALRLFGFARPLDRKVFEGLVSISGVGPKLAALLLGPLSGAELCGAIGNGQGAVLVAIPGVGAKTADRILLEFGTKARSLLGAWDGAVHADLPGRLQGQPSSEVLADLESALLNMGYKQKQIAGHLDEWKKHPPAEPLALEPALRDILKRLSGALFSRS